jgi:uncharacterized membrane protein (UPF0127 family)
MNERVLRNASNGRVLASRVTRAENFIARGLGLLPRATVEEDEGIWIDGCSAIHTVGMRATIDLFFLDREGRILKIVNRARPNRLVISCARSVAVVELGHGERPRDVLVGDRLVLD